MAKLKKFGEDAFQSEFDVKVTKNVCSKCDFKVGIKNGQKEIDKICPECGAEMNIQNVMEKKIIEKTCPKCGGGLAMGGAILWNEDAAKLCPEKLEVDFEIVSAYVEEHEIEGEIIILGCKQCHYPLVGIFRPRDYIEEENEQ